jgi:hypothetical protein
VIEMATNAAQRIAKWDAKFNTERIKAVLDTMRPNMLVNVQAVFPLIESMETQVKQVLDMQGISTSAYANYLAFGREVWRLKRMGVSGDSLAAEVAIHIAKWVARGLSLSILETIRSQVFDVPAPI